MSAEETYQSLMPLFHPKAIALIGASGTPGKIGYKILRALIESGFKGPLYPVNPTKKEVLGLPTFASPAAVPGPFDLGVIAVPASEVKSAAIACHAKGARALVVISAGFAETGDEGKKLQADLVKDARERGLRLVGPNCFGVLHTHPEASFNASFSPFFALPGNVAIASQSGAMGLAVLALARQQGLGLSAFVSMGNKADVSSNDLIEFWEKDARTDVILLYLESFGNPEKFSRIASRVSRKKVIVALKSGRTATGAKAAGSHTAALAASDLTVNALFRQTGVIRAETLEEWFGASTALSTQPLPEGKRVGIITNAGGPAILCADVCEANSLRVPELSEGLQSSLRVGLPPTASLRNPLDLIASAGPEQMAAAVRKLMTSNEIDALIVIHAVLDKEIDPRFLSGLSTAVVEARASGSRIPVLLCLLKDASPSPPLAAGKEKIPCYRFPEEPARALAHMARLSEWRRRPAAEPAVYPEVDMAAIREIVRNSESEWLSPADTWDVLSMIGLPTLQGGIARTAEEAVAMARRIGTPVAMKLVSKSITHKTEVGGVRLDLAGESEILEAFSAIQKAVPDLDGVLVQPMVRGGTELFVGMSRDAVFGPVLAFGLGGILVEALSDISFGVAPLTPIDVREMMRSIRGAKILAGYRGRPPIDDAAVVEVILRLSSLATSVPEIQSIDLNPLIARARGEGCLVIDARIQVRRA